MTTTPQTAHEKAVEAAEEAALDAYMNGKPREIDTKAIARAAITAYNASLAEQAALTKSGEAIARWLCDESNVPEGHEGWGQITELRRNDYREIAGRMLADLRGAAARIEQLDGPARNAAREAGRTALRKRMRWTRQAHACADEVIDAYEAALAAAPSPGDGK